MHLASMLRPEPFNQQVAEGLLSRLIASVVLSFRLVENAGFRKFVGHLLPEFAVKTGRVLQEN